MWHGRATCDLADTPVRKCLSFCVRGDQATLQSWTVSSLVQVWSLITRQLTDLWDGPAGIDELYIERHCYSDETGIPPEEAGLVGPRPAWPSQITAHMRSATLLIGRRDGAGLQLHRLLSRNYSPQLHFYIVQRNDSRSPLARIARFMDGLQSMSTFFTSYCLGSLGEKSIYPFFGVYITERQLSAILGNEITSSASASSPPSNDQFNLRTCQLALPSLVAFLCGLHFLPAALPLPAPTKKRPDLFCSGRVSLGFGTPQRVIHSWALFILYLKHSQSQLRPSQGCG